MSVFSRRKGRYNRRQIRRKQNKINRVNEIRTISHIFTYKKMFFYGRDCCRDVRWKCSIQRFELHLFSGTARRRKQVLRGTYTWHQYVHFWLWERGKLRPIDAPHVHDRQVQKVLSKELLLPLYQPLMIWNNGASLPHKGLAFTRAELVKALVHHYNKYGLTGWIMIADCSKFFPNAQHDMIRRRHQEVLLLPDFIKIMDSILDTISSGVGMPLGVEPSQMEMIMYPTGVDTFMTCQAGLRGFGHYMDDYVSPIPPTMDPNVVMQTFLHKAAQEGMIISEHKTKIVPFGQPFKFCKVKYQILPNGKILQNGCRQNIKKSRHKLKSFQERVLSGQMTYTELWNSVQGVLSYYEQFNDHGRVLRLRRLFYSLYGFSCESYQNFKEAELRWHTSSTDDLGPKLLEEKSIFPMGQ